MIFMQNYTWWKGVDILEKNVENIFLETENNFNLKKINKR